MVTDVHISVPKAKLRKVPKHVLEKLLFWVDLVGMQGLEEVRKIPGFHDEPLGGKRTGQRSIRLSKKFRAFYRLENGSVEFVDVFEVNAHKY